MKELEQTFTKQAQINEKERNDLVDKLNSLQKKFDELNFNYNNEKNTSRKQINLLTQEKDSFKSG